MPFISDHSAALVIWILTWLGAAIPERASLSRRRREGATSRDRGSHRLFIICLIPAVVVLVLSRKFAPGVTIRPPVVAFIVGEIMFVGGMALRLWAIRTLGQYFTVIVQTSADQPVITTGPYRLVRHPSYTGILLIAIGGGLVVGNWIGLAALTILILIPLVYRIQVEDDALMSTLGEPYRTYASRHKRLIPGLW